jgi:protein-L-isoaspartate(D-aspartate) O-methyltransferase
MRNARFTRSLHLRGPGFGREMYPDESGSAHARAEGVTMQDDMIRTIEQHMRDTSAEIGRDALSPRVIAALREVPRERFVPPVETRFAFSDSPLPIGHGQTISQPFIVALMTELLDPQPGDRVLEVGTGSGYQAAVLAELAGEVYGIEIVPALARRAAEVLRELGYANVTVKAGDGFHGWPEHAPFDGIMVTAAGEGVPEPLKQQLRIGGRLVLPVEDAAGWQTLDVIERTGEKNFRTRHTIPVRFVPLTGTH